MLSIFCPCTYCNKLLLIPLELPGHSLNQWLSTTWEGVANPDSSGASYASEWPESVETGSTPPHPHVRVRSQGSSISLDRLHSFWIVTVCWKGWANFFLLCYLLLLHSTYILVEGAVTVFHCHTLKYGNLGYKVVPQ